jgi:perosamine synthetase
MNLSKFKLVACEMGSNYQLKDGLVAAKSFLFGSSKSDEEFCQTWFKDYLDLNENQKLFFTDNGRTGLYLLLKSLNLEPESEVLIQGFSCVVLPNSVWQAGLTPVLCDVDEKTYNFDLEKLESKITPKTKVLVIQYTFGIVPNMQEVVDFCRKHNLYLIEDCAHSLGAKGVVDNKNYKLGQIGYGAFFSFGRDKIVSTTIGGLTIVNSNPLPEKNKNQHTPAKNLTELKSQNNLENWNFQKYQKELESNYSQLPQMGLKRELQALSYAILAVFLVRPFYHFIFGKLVLFFGRKIKIIADIYTEAEETGTSSLETNSKYSPKLFSLLKNQLLKFEKYANHRKQLALFYYNNLPTSITTFDDDFKLMDSQKEGGYINQEFSSNIKNIYLRYPVNFSNLEFYFDKYTRIKAGLRKNGIIIGTWYTSLFMQPDMNLENKFGYKKGSLPTSEKLIDRAVLNLPTNINTSLSDAERICKIIKENL